MHPHLDPLAVFLEIGGEGFPALSFSEAGLTLPAEVLRATPPDQLRRGRRHEATLHLTCDDSSDAYPVEIKLAGSSPDFVELAFSTLPAQARLRMRHASGSVLAHPDLRWISDAEMDRHHISGEMLPNGRRFALRTSEPLWHVTRRRRGVPPPAPREAPMPREEMPRPAFTEPPPKRRASYGDVAFVGALAVLVTVLLFLVTGL